MIYVYLASFVGFFASVISMAEISSMYVSSIAAVRLSRTESDSQPLAPQHPEVNTTGSANSLLQAGNDS